MHMRFSFYVYITSIFLKKKHTPGYKIFMNTMTLMLQYISHFTPFIGAITQTVHTYIVSYHSTIKLFVTPGVIKLTFCRL